MHKLFKCVHVGRCKEPPRHLEFSFCFQWHPPSPSCPRLPKSLHAFSDAIGAVLFPHNTLTQYIPGTYNCLTQKHGNTEHHVTLPRVIFVRYCGANRIRSVGVPSATN